MNVKDENLVIVRGINSDWKSENFLKMWVGFSGPPQAIPKDDAYYVGLYLEKPESAITHIGIVSDIKREDDETIFHMKALIKLKNKISTSDGHAIRKHENWKLSDFGLDAIELRELRNSIMEI